MLLQIIDGCVFTFLEIFILVIRIYFLLKISGCKKVETTYHICYFSRILHSYQVFSVFISNGSAWK